MRGACKARHPAAAHACMTAPVAAEGVAQMADHRCSPPSQRRKPRSSCTPLAAAAAAAAPRAPRRWSEVHLSPQRVARLQPDLCSSTAQMLRRATAGVARRAAAVRPRDMYFGARIALASFWFTPRIAPRSPYLSVAKHFQRTSWAAQRVHLTYLYVS